MAAHKPVAPVLLTEYSALFGSRTTSPKFVAEGSTPSTSAVRIPPIHSPEVLRSDLAQLKRTQPATELQASMLTCLDLIFAWHESPTCGLALS